MKNRAAKYLQIISVLIVGLTPLSFTKPVLAASATLSLSPAAASVTQGSSISLSIYENSGSDAINAVQANLAYPADKFDFVSITSASAFPIIGGDNHGGGGSIKISRATTSSLTGRQMVASVRFKAKASSGTANVSFASGSEVAASDGKGTNIFTGSSGGSYTLRAAPAPVAAPPKDTIPPTIKDVATTDITTTTAIVTWTTSEPATSEVSYGLNNGYGLSAIDNSFVTDHKVTLSSALLTPGTVYHFMVRSVDPAGNAVTSPDGSFTTKGLSLAVTVVNQKNKPVSGAKVSLASSSAVTDKKGQATLNGLPLGKQTGTVTYKGKQTAVSVVIEPIDPKAAPQAVSFKIQTPGTNPLVIIIPLVAILLAVGLLIRARGRGPRTPGPHSPTDRSLPFLAAGPKTGPTITPADQPAGPTIPPTSQPSNPTIVPPAQNAGPTIAPTDQPPGQL